MFCLDLKLELKNHDVGICILIPQLCCSVNGGLQWYIKSKTTYQSMIKYTSTKPRHSTLVFVSIITVHLTFEFKVPSCVNFLRYRCQIVLDISMKQSKHSSIMVECNSEHEPIKFNDILYQC